MDRILSRLALLTFVLVAFAALLSSPALAQGPSQASASAAPAAPPAPPDVAEVPFGVEKSDSGLAWKILKKGTGKVHPTAADRVTVNYNGWTTNGRIFDSTEMRGKPSNLPVAGVLPGMTEAFKLMVVGEKRRFWMPAELAFKSAPGKPQGMCVFEIELVDIQAGAAQPAVAKGVPPTPADVAAPPADAEKSKSGLAWKVLKKGTGTKHPKADSTVTAHYTLWTPDGKMLESSLQSGQPATFQLNRVIQGWTEGVQLMVEGEQRLFWVPGALAYDKLNREDAPKGMLVFQIELVKIQ